MTEFRFVYITTETEDEALDLGRKIVAHRLAACVNILKEIKSIYWWQGKMEEASETALIAKTRADRLADLTQKVKEWHPYDCPCVVALPLSPGEGNQDYLDWIGTEAGPVRV